MNKQEQVDALVVSGKTSKEIALALQMNIASVRYYREKSKRANRSENNRKVSEHRRKLKRKAVEYSGGSCRKCDYAKSLAALTFHHLNPDEKEYNLASGKTMGWLAWKTEIDKCLLLCHNCHSELHDGMWGPNAEMIESQRLVRAFYEDAPLISYKDEIIQTIVLET